MPTRIQTLSLLAWVATVTTPAGAVAQDVLLELPAEVRSILPERQADARSPLRLGAQLSLDQADRMPFSPGVSLALRPRDWRMGSDESRLGAQFGAGLRAPTHGSAGRAAERSRILGPAVVVEPVLMASHGVLPGLLLAARGFARVEWQLARVADQARAPLFLAAGLQGGVGVGPCYAALDLSVARHVWDGGTAGEFLRVAEETPRVALLAVVDVWTHVQVFARLTLNDDPSKRGTLWTAGLAGSVAAIDG
ncbi:MAG: hypothetical protein OXU20_19385 [Myxococcales bacterium]|nr:hypothetical protein [Myxococcales bacterium]